MHRRPRILLLVCVLASLLAPALASASIGSHLETRVGGLDLGNPYSVKAERPVTPGTHQGYRSAYDAVASDSLLAARGGARTVARNLAEKLALDEAKGGAGKRIIQGMIKDPKFPENIWAKMQHVHQNPGGTQTVIHYWENLVTGAREGFKFK